MAQGMSLTSGAGMATIAGSLQSILGNFNQALEYQRQTKFQRNLLEAEVSQLRSQQESVTRDIDVRARIMSGTVMARAGKGGVSSSSGSVINAAADIMGKAEVDKLRMNVMVHNKIELARFQQRELARRSRKTMNDAISGSLMDAGITSLKFAG